MLAVPLFHVHPDTDHRHGEPGHVHGGTVHTVLSRDLDCEFRNAQMISGSAQAAHREDWMSAHQSHRWNEHPEFGISLLTDPTDRKSLKPSSTHVLVVASAVVSSPKLHLWIQQSRVSLRISTLLSQDLQSRAPPLLLI
jgi:hypothetical protein